MVNLEYKREYGRNKFTTGVTQNEASNPLNFETICVSPVQLEKGEGEAFKRLSLSRQGVKHIERNGDEISIIPKGISGEGDKKVGILVGEHMVVRSEITAENRGLSRRQFLKLSGATVASLLLISLGLESTSADTGLEDQEKLIKEEQRKKRREEKRREEKEFQKDVFSLSRLLGKHWGYALRGPEGKSAGDEYFLPESKQCLLFGIKAKEILRDENVKRRLYGIATFTDVGDIKPPYPPKELKPDSYWREFPQDHFVSPHFGPHEFDRLAHTRLTRLNLALCCAIGLTEHGAIDLRLFDRLAIDKGSWNSDPFNAHIGRDAARYFTGITNNQIGGLGPEAHGGIFSQNNTELPDRLITILQPLILTLRTFQPLPSDGKIKNLEIVNENGEPKYDLLRAYYPPSEVWLTRFSHIYTAFEEFCKQRSRYGWLLYQNVLDKPLI